MNYCNSPKVDFAIYIAVYPEIGVMTNDADHL